MGIRKPVDIAKIQQRIEEDRYEDMDALERDFMTLCKNTQHYNEDGSLIFEDSIVLQSVFTNARERIEQEADEPEPVQDEDDEDVGKVQERRKKGSNTVTMKMMSRLNLSVLILLPVNIQYVVCVVLLYWNDILTILILE